MVGPVAGGVAADFVVAMAAEMVPVQFTGVVVMGIGFHCVSRNPVKVPCYSSKERPCCCNAGTGFFIGFGGLAP